MITCPSCGHKNNPWANACVKCTEPLTSKSKDTSNEIIGYRCPTCKTITYGNSTHCICGHWLLDSKFPAEPVTGNEYVKGYWKNRKNNNVTSLKGSEKKGKTLVKFIGFALIAFVIFSLFVTGNDKTTTEPKSSPTYQTMQQKTLNQTPPPEPKKANLELLEHKSTSDEYGRRYVIGSIKNNTSKRYSYVRVEINLYDGALAQVGSTVDNTNNLEPGGIWKFKATILEDSVRKYKIINVSGF